MENEKSSRPGTEIINIDSSTAENRNTATTSQKRMFKFNDETKYIMLQCIRQHNAHLAGHGKADQQFRKVLQTFIENIPSHLKVMYNMPTVRAMRDKFRSLLIDRKNYVKFIEAQSGVVDQNSPVEDLLDDFIQEVEDVTSKKRKRANENEEREAELETAGQLIQQQSVTRRQTSRNLESQESMNDEIVPVGQMESELSVTAQPCRKIMRGDDNMAEWNMIIQKQLNDKKAIDVHNLQLRARELEIQKDKWEEEKKDREASREKDKANTALMLCMAENMKSAFSFLKEKDSKNQEDEPSLSENYDDDK